MPPDYVLRGLRMGIGVFLTIFIAYCLINYKLLEDGRPESAHTANLVGSAASAAAITCVVVASPVVGKVLIVGIDRTIGTILGGLCGWGAFVAAHQIWNGDYLGTYGTLSILAFLAAFGSVVIAWKLAKLETTPRLFTLTFILVALGSDDPERDFEVMISRIGGIVCGSFISLVVAVFVYPISATESVLESIKRALQGLAELNAAAIHEGKHALGHARDADQEDEEMGLQSPLLSYEEASSHSESCEEALMKIVSALLAVHEMLPLSQNEAYVGTFFGRMWFLPGLVWCGLKHIPKEQIKEVVTDIRCTAWLLWRIHLAFRQMAFRQGMGAHFALVLTKMLPPDMVLRLAASAQAAFNCLVAAFPAVGPTTPGLEQFKQTVAELMALTGQQHRQLLRHMREEQEWARQPPTSTGQAPTPMDAIKQAAEASYQGKQQDTSPPDGTGRDGEAGSASADERLWDAARAEIHLPMPESEVGAERDMMAAEGLSGADPRDQAAFPSCAAEQVAEVRWYTFQFLMEELAEALECLHMKLHMLSQQLPDPAIQLQACHNHKQEQGLI